TVWSRSPRTSASESPWSATKESSPGASTPTGTWSRTSTCSCAASTLPSPSFALFCRRSGTPRRRKHVRRPDLLADQLAGDEDVRFAACAPDAQRHGGALRTADGGDRAFEPEPCDGHAVDGHDLVARCEAGIRGAGSWNDLLDLQHGAPCAEDGADSRELEASAVARTARCERDGERRRLAVVRNPPEGDEAHQIPRLPRADADRVRRDVLEGEAPIRSALRFGRERGDRQVRRVPAATFERKSDAG